MNTGKNILPLIPALVAGMLLVSVVMPATALPIKGNVASIEGAGCIAARSSLVQDYGSFTLAGAGSAAGDLRACAPALPEGCLSGPGSGENIPETGLPGVYLSMNMSGNNQNAVQSGKEALISRLTGRTITPGEPGGTSSTLVSGEGTIRFIGLEGGFFGIVTPAGENYLPENLPATMKVDGTRVRFEGVVRARGSDTVMWGTPISLITVSLPAQGFSGAGTVRFIELEGGFFGIVTTAGDNYLPLNLPDDFQVDGLQVSFTAREVPDAATIAMWGTPIRIETISRFGPQPGELGGSWSLVSLDGSPLIPGTTISASFRSGRVTGSTGCNQYFASYVTAGSSLAIGNAGSTRMYCNSAEGAMEQEARYLSLLPQASGWSLQDGRLVIRDASGSEILVYAPANAREPGVLIEYSRTGGFAGFDDHLVISSDGTATVTRKETTRQVPVLELTMRHLTALLSAADFPSLNDVYPAPQEGADYFTYTLTHDGKTVMIEDTGIPAVIVPVINILNEIVESSAPDGVIPALS